MHDDALLYDLVECPFRTRPGVDIADCSSNTVSIAAPIQTFAVEDVYDNDGNRWRSDAMDSKQVDRTCDDGVDLGTMSKTGSTRTNPPITDLRAPSLELVLGAQRTNF